MLKKILVFLILIFTVSTAEAKISAGVSVEDIKTGEIKLLPKIEQKLPTLDLDVQDMSYWVKFRPLELLSQDDLYSVHKAGQNISSNFLYDKEFMNEADENAYWEMVLEQNSNRAEYFYGYAIYLKTNQKMAEALKYLDKTINLNPDFALAHFLKGDIYRTLGQYRNSLYEYILTIKINPYCADAYFNIAQTLQNFGQTELALDFYGYAYLVNPNDIEARNMILKLRRNLASKN